MKKIGLILGIMLPMLAHAQNEVDALRYSYLQFGGTARYNGMAGAFGALGADLSVSSVNPAGIARFNKSEFSFTPGLTTYGTKADYNLNRASNADLRLNMSNIGYVSSTQLKTDNYNRWQSFQFAVTYNKLAVFNQSATVAGPNTNSMLAVFAQQANGTYPEDLYDYLPYTSYLAYETYAMDTLSTNASQYTHHMQYGDVYQQRTIDRKGGYNETDFTFSGNYDNRFYIGGTIGLPGVRYTEDYSHYETPSFDTSATDISDFVYNYSQTTRGTGINAKIGVIFVPVDFLRIGFAAHTRTRLSFNDRWFTSMATNFENGDSYYVESPNGNYNYIITTPGRLVGSIAGIIAKKGVISADVEYIDYSKASIKSSPRFGSNYPFTLENQEISTQYAPAINVRVGGEVRLQKFFLRGGYALYGSPYDKTNPDLVQNSASRSTYTLGVGFRNKNFFMDMAYMLTAWKEDYYLYDPVIINPATLNNSISNISFTIGFRY